MKSGYKNQKINTTVPELNIYRINAENALINLSFLLSSLGSVF